jgi:hypothetical protein
MRTVVSKVKRQNLRVRSKGAGEVRLLTILADRGEKDHDFKAGKGSGVHALEAFVRHRDRKEAEMLHASSEKLILGELFDFVDFRSEAVRVGVLKNDAILSLHGCLLEALLQVRHEFGF